MGGRGYLSNIFSCWPAATAEKTGQSRESCGKRQIEILWRYECLSFFAMYANLAFVLCSPGFLLMIAMGYLWIPMGCYAINSWIWSTWQRCHESLWTTEIPSRGQWEMWCVSVFFLGQIQGQKLSFTCLKTTEIFQHLDFAMVHGNVKSFTQENYTRILNTR